MLTALSEGRVHVAVVDVSLNEANWEGRRVDGVELTRLLKSQAEKLGRHLPVLLSTAHAMAGDRERLLAESGADDYLEKPVYEAAQLVEKVRALLKLTS
jgi:CheY-like chemotaxis protein